MANKNIKGITIEIDGNTTPLSNALKDLNKDIRAVDKELKNVDQALKLDPGNADQVARKLELLEEKAELAEKKVESLKQAQKQMDAEGVDKASKEYQSLTTEIAKAEGAYRDIQTQIERTGKSFQEVSEGSRQLQTFLQATGQSADELTSILGSKLVDAIKSGQLGAAGYQTVLNKLSQEFTGTAKNADLLKNALSTSSLDEAKQSLNQLSTSASDYRTKLTDLEQAQNRLNTYFNATGTSVKDFANVLGSELVAKIQSGKASSQELATALDKIGASATQNRGDLDRFKSTLDSVDSGVSFDRIKAELNQLGSEFKEGESDVEGFKSKLESIADSSAASAMADVSDAIGEISDKAGELADAFLDSSSTVQDATAQIKVGLGETGEEAEKSLEIVRSVYRDGYGESIDGVTEKFVYMKQVLGDAVDPSQLQPLLEQFITLEDGGMDFNETVRAAEQLMYSFGISSDEAMNLLTTGMQNGLNKTDELGDNITEYSGRWAEAGMSASQYFSLLEAGANNGAYNLDKVGDYLNEFLTSLADGRLEESIGSFSQGTQEIFQAYQEGGATAQDVLNACITDMQNMTSETDRAALASTIWSSLGEDNAMGMILALGNVEDKYGDLGGAAEQATEDNSNSVTQMKAAWEDFKLAFAPVGEKLAEVGTTILTKLQPVIEWLAKALENMDPSIATFIAAFVGISAVIGPIVATIGGLVMLLGGPVTAAIAGVIAAVAGVIAIFTNWDSIVENVKEAWGVLCQVLQRDWNNFVEWITGVFSSIGETLGGLWNSFCETLSNAWNTIWTGIQEGWNTIVEWFTSIFTGIGDAVGGAWNTFTQGITDAWNSVWSGIQDAWNGIASWFSEAFDNVKSTVSDIWNGFIEFLSNAWNEFWEREKTGWTNIFNFLSDTFNSIKDKATEIWNNITSFLSDTWNSIKDNANNIWNNISSFLSDTWNTVKDNASSTWNNIKDNTISTWNNLKENAGSTWDNIKSTITDHAQQIKDNLSNKWNEVVSNFSQIWSGLKDKASQIWEDVKRVVSEGVNRLKDLMNFHWELPKIKLPHFSISGEFSLNPPSIPSISVDWYAKGGILTKPTIFGMNGNSLLGGGEAGKEAVAPLNDLTGMIRDAVRDEVDLTETNNLLKELIERSNIQVVLDNGVLVGTLASRMNQNLGNLAKREARQ